MHPRGPRLRRIDPRRCVTNQLPAWKPFRLNPLYNELGMSRNLSFSLAGLLFATCVLETRSFSGVPGPPSLSIRFTDVARKAGIDVHMVNGGARAKKD